MNLRQLMAIAIAGSMLAFAVPEPVMADGMPSARPVVKRVVAKHYRARYVRGLWPGGPDPYAYSYERPGYYPAYNSAYWVPRRQMIGRSRYPMRIPEYASSWGYPLTCKLTRRRHCGVPFVSPSGDAEHYYRRDVQIPRHHL